MPLYFEGSLLLSEWGTRQNRNVEFFLLKQQTFPLMGKEATAPISPGASNQQRTG